jgi:hypothetical protein
VGLTTREVRTIDRCQAAAFIGLAVSPDGTVLLRVAKSMEFDLMLVENFQWDWRAYSPSISPRSFARPVARLLRRNASRPR